MFIVWGSGIEVSLGFGVQGLGFRVRGLGIAVLSVGFVSRLGLRERLAWFGD
jgi:hypothetical protein